MPDNLPLNVLTIAFGLFVGTYGSLIGVGGGFLVVPALLWQGASPQQAIGTSLLVVFLNALSGSISYARKRRIDLHTGILFSVWVFPGALGGVFLSSMFSAKSFSFAFGFLLLLLSVFLFLRPVGQPEERVLASDTDLGWWRRRTTRHMPNGNGGTLSYSFHTARGYLLSFLVGFVSSLFGIGGGIIHVPAMVHFLNFPVHIATATSLFILAISAGIGAVAHLLLGNVLPVPALLIGAGVVFGAQLGAYISPRVHAQWLVRLLSLALVAVSMKLLVL